MDNDRNALKVLNSSLEGCIEAYESSRHIFNEFPKVDIEGLFRIWEEYINFLDGNRVQEAQARKEREESGGFVPKYHLIMDGGYSKGVSKQVEEVFKENRARWNQIFSEGRFAEHSREIEGELSNLKSWDLLRFFVHDIYHLRGDLEKRFLCLSNPRGIATINTMRQRREQVRTFLELYNQNPEFLFGCLIEPYKMIHYVATGMLGEQPRLETFTPADLAWKVGFILQNRSPPHEFSLVSKPTATEGNEIIVDAEPFSVIGNSGVVFSVIYNLAKNAYKKIESKPIDASPIKIAIQVYQVPLGNYVITVADSGYPMDINLMKDKIRKAVLDDGIDSVIFPTRRFEKVVRNWEQSPYRVNELSVGDLVDVAFMARMSGFDNSSSFSSGMGLYGIKNLASNVGARIMYGEKFEDGSPVFTVILPKEFPTSPIQRAGASLASRIVGAELYRNGDRTTS